MNSTLFRKALFTLVASIGFAIPVMSMDVASGTYSKAYGKNAELLTKLIEDIENLKTPNDQIITRITQAPQLLKLRLRWGYTLLAAAANAGRLPVVQHIINEGFAENVNGDAAINTEVTEHLETPFSLAAKKGHQNVVKYLLDMGPTQANLQKALAEAQRANQPIIVQLLQQRIAPTQPTQPATQPAAQPTQQPVQPSRGLEGLDALKNVEKRRYPQNFDAIKNVVGNIINKSNQQGATEKAIQAIRQNKAFINIEMQYGRTLLILAVQNRRTEIVQALLDAGADINYPDDHGNTPLMLAAQNGNVEIVRLLLDRGATVNLFNKKKQTALNLALKNGHQNVVALLVPHNAKLFFTMVIAFTPPQAELLASINFDILKRSIHAAQELEPVPNTEIHLSILYCSALIDYDKFIQRTTENIFNTVSQVVEKFGLKEKCVNLTRDHQFLFTGLEKMGPYVVIRYNTPEGYQQLINELFRTIQQAVQVPVLQTYDEIQKPHISIAKEVKDKPKFEANLGPVRSYACPLTHLTFQQGVYELSMRVPALGNLTPKNKELFTTKHAWNAHAPAQLLFA